VPQVQLNTNKKHPSKKPGFFNFFADYNPIQGGVKEGSKRFEESTTRPLKGLSSKGDMLKEARRSDESLDIGASHRLGGDARAAKSKGGGEDLVKKGGYLRFLHLQRRGKGLRP